MRRPVVTVVACVGACLALARVARADDLPSLRVHRTDDTLDCPDAAALAIAVEKQMKRPALTPDGRRAGLEVQIYKSSLGYTAVLVTGAKTRQISDAGPTCAGLGDALAVMIAIVLDDESEVPRPANEPPPEEPRVEATSAVGPRPPGKATVPYDPWPYDTEMPVVDLPPPPRQWSIAASFGGITSLGVTTPGAYGVSGDVQARASKVLSFDVGVAFLAPRRIAFEVGTIDVSLTATFLRTCFTLLGSPARIASLGACVEPMVGALHALSSGYRTIASNPSVSKPWIALQGMAVVEGNLFGPVGYVAHAGLAVPFVRQAFSIQDPNDTRTQNVAFQPWPIGGVLDAELRVRIW